MQSSKEERKQGLVLRSCGGQILVEALIASAVMLIIMLAISRLMEQKKMYKKNSSQIEERMRFINSRE